MSKKIEILAPNLPESISDATIINWYKKSGDYVSRNELLLEVETDKITLEVVSPVSGIIDSLLNKVGDNVCSNQVVGYINKFSPKESDVQENQIKEDQNENNSILSKYEKINNSLSPSKRRSIIYDNINKNKKIDTDKKEIQENIQTENVTFKSTNMGKIERSVNRTRMSKLRKTISERLLAVQHNTAMLTTFNEVNMNKIINIRKKYSELFKEKYGTKIGFMSFYVKAVLESLKIFPEINSFIDKDDIVNYNYFDISIAISTYRGLVTPVLRNVDKLSLSDIEIEIYNMANKARNNKLKLEDLNGGNFTISNGGIFGSLMSTPIINPPQSAILGIHAIKDRPMALNGKIVILPMVYLALSYDHRLIDGKDSVSFLLNIKEILEDPIRLLLQV